jgi:hypothetical protein
LTGPVGALSYAEFKALNPPSYPHFQTEDQQFGSWLSKLTGVHISPKGVSLSAPDPIGFVKDVVTNPIADVVLGSLLIPGVGSALLSAAGSTVGAAGSVLHAIPAAIGGLAHAVTGAAGAVSGVAGAANAVSSVTSKPSNVPAAQQAPTIDYVANTATLNGLTLSLSVYQSWIAANPTAPPGAVFLAAYNATPAPASVPVPIPAALPVPVLPVPAPIAISAAPMAKTTAVLPSMAITATPPTPLNPMYLAGGAALLFLLLSGDRH